MKDCISGKTLKTLLPEDTNGTEIKTESLSRKTCKRLEQSCFFFVFSIAKASHIETYYMT